MPEIIRVRARRNGRKIETVAHEVIQSDDRPVSFDVMADFIINRMREDGILPQASLVGGREAAGV